MSGVGTDDGRRTAEQAAALVGAPSPEVVAQLEGHAQPTLTDFLLARIAEDEAVARAASPSPWQYGTVESVAGGSLYDATRMIGAVHYEQPEDHDGRIVRHLLSDEANANGVHIARHDPARVLAECEAKRRIVQMHRPSGEFDSDACILCQWDIDCEAPRADHHDGAGSFPCDTVKVLAAIYSDHPEWRDEWRP